MSTLFIRFAARGSPPFQRSPLIERLIARASSSARVLNWRAEAFGLLAPSGTVLPPVAAMALRGAAEAGVQGAAPGAGGYVSVATPVHLSAGMTQVTFPVDGILRLDSAEAAALAADFSTVFDGAGVRLVVGQAGILLCVFDQWLDVNTHDPEAAVGQDVFGFQPSGSDAPRLRRLSSEIEMWLFNHAVNAQRAAGGRVPITGLWFWGGGASDASIPALSLWAAGGDAFFGAWGDAEVLGDAAKPARRSGSGVVVLRDLPGSQAWPLAEGRWLRPALTALHDGRLEQIHVSAAQSRFTITRGWNLRFWRRARPWWEAFELCDGASNGNEE